MTWVNAGIEPWELSDKLLQTELKDLQTIPATVRAMEANRTRRSIGTASRVNILEGIPAVFTTDKPAHIKFFFPRIEYLHKRYRLLYADSRARGMDLQNCDQTFRVEPQYYGDWIETPQSRLLSIERITMNGRLRTKRKRPINL